MKRGPKPTYQRFRIEALERHIGRSIALDRPDATAALRYFARDIGADPSEQAINENAEMYRKELARKWKELHP